MSAITDADIHAFGAEPAEARRAAPPNPTPRRWWPWVVLALAVAFVTIVVLGVLMLGGALDMALGGLDIRVDDEHLLSIPKGEAVWWALAAALLVAMVVLVVVPLSLLLALLVAVVALVAAVFVALAVAAVALSPLWVVALLLWLALRERRRAAPTAPHKA